MVRFSKKYRCVFGLASLALATMASAQRVAIPLGAENFSVEALVRGVHADELQCSQLRGAVWARAPSGEAECIRYWSAGLSMKSNLRAMIYIPPDQLAFDKPEPSYSARNPASVQAITDIMQLRAEVPFILLSRPGILGSSGDHKQRRRELEARLVSAALDQIKKRYAINEWVLVGLSGGGHTVASLLGWRSDVVCAVAASAVSSPRMRWQLMGRDADLTGYTDSYEPVEHQQPGNFKSGLRVFVLGDTRDSNVLWQTQIPLATRLKKLGVAAELLNGEGSDPQHHALGESARVIGSLCAQGRLTEEIMECAARGLKGRVLLQLCSSDAISSRTQRKSSIEL